MFQFIANTISLNPLPKSTANNGQITTILGIVFGIVGALAVLMVVVSGFRYILAAGDPQQAAKAKNGLIYSLVGMIVAIAANVIVQFVLGKL